LSQSNEEITKLSSKYALLKPEINLTDKPDGATNLKVLPGKKKF